MRSSSTPLRNNGYSSGGGAAHFSFRVFRDFARGFPCWTARYALCLCLLAPLARAQSPDAAASPRLDPAAYQRLIDENLDLRREKTRVEAEAEGLRRRNAALLVDLQDMERRKNQLTLVMSQMKTPEESRLEIERLQGEKKALVLEMERLRRALAESARAVTNSVPVVAPAPSSDLFRKIEKENADLRQELAGLRASVQNGVKTRDQMLKEESLLKEEMARLTDRNRQAADDLEAARRREAALKKALGAEAKKAFEAERIAREIQDAQKEEQRKKAEAAVKEIVWPIRAADRSVDVLLNDARRHLEAKRVREAESDYLQALKLEPDNPRVSYNLGVLYGDYLNAPRKAVRYYKQYLKLAPRAPDAPVVRSWITQLDAKW